jgi:hypothetical protein
MVVNKITGPREEPSLRGGRLTKKGRITARFPRRWLRCERKNAVNK